MHEVTATRAEVDEVAVHTLALATLFARGTTPPRMVCEGCGCLCLPTETCPGCRAGLSRRPVRARPVRRSMVRTVRVPIGEVAELERGRRFTPRGRRTEAS